MGLDPNAPTTQERSNAAQVNDHESLSSFIDNLTTLMFIVASDLSETQREKLTSSLYLRGMDIPAYTFEAVKTVFAKLFCTPKSSMENQSGHVSSMNRTFIVEEHAANDFGQWAADEVTGEQGYVDDERSCFWTWDNTECAWQSGPFKGRQVRRRKGKGKGVGRGRSKRTGRAFFGDEQAQDPECWQEEDLVWWS